MRVSRWRVVVHLAACLLLTLAAADLFVPQLCSGEEVSQASAGTSSRQAQDDCFGCCSHIKKALIVTVVNSEGLPVIVEHFPIENLSDGVPPGLYRPPLLS